MSEAPSTSSREVVRLSTEADCEALGAFLADRIYEFNVRATGYADAMPIAGCVRSTDGEILAGYNGYTWGGYCELTHVWVDERHRGQGLGSLMLRAAESEALDRGCLQVVLATHDFQAPGFYERMGYERRFVLEGRPRGHVDIIYAKVFRHDLRRGEPSK